MESLDIQAAHRWRQAALDHGWSCEALYRNEPWTWASRLTNKAGWIAHVISRPEREDEDQFQDRRILAPQAQIHVWAPGKVKIEEVPVPYSWRQLVLNAQAVAVEGT